MTAPESPRVRRRRLDYDGWWVFVTRSRWPSGRVTWDAEMNDFDIASDANNLHDVWDAIRDIYEDCTGCGRPNNHCCCP